ncbi:MAG: 5-(carboxyamino)imidazole ribonucleotide mutase [Balneolaceae bacterium]|nr:5-(carboxyamino)imidazole ribonucleotide mutase [Balneolaceae bacterium]
MSDNLSPKVGIIMGSDSDWPTMKVACDILDELDIPYEKKVVSAHRTPDMMADYGKSARERGIKVIIAGAGGAAHLPGMTAAYTTLPVIGVPVKTSTLNGMDSLYSIVQMPNGVPVATVAIGKAKNAGLLAARILSTSDKKLTKKLVNYHEQMAEESKTKTQNLI